MRWDELSTDRDVERRLPGIRDPAVVRTFDAPEALNVRFYETQAKSALNRVPKASRMSFRWTINPYRGCTHACHFCFARPTHTYLDFNAREDFEREIVVKVNVPELVRAEVGRPSWKREHVALGTNTDPYQWVESRYQLMPGIWKALRDSETPCSVLTKSPLLLRDIDLFAAMAAEGMFSASLSIPTLDEKAWRATEPHTPHPRKRIEAIAELVAAGVPTGVLIAPVIPGVNDAPEQIEPLVEACYEAGAHSVSGIALHLRGEVKDIWFEWLEENRPDLIDRYQAIYQRGAYATSEERKRIAALFKRSSARPKRSDGFPKAVRRLGRGSERAGRNSSHPFERAEARGSDPASTRPAHRQQSLF